ncbi:MAG: mitochondrial fission ELM1 family protein [Hyphomonadaceae bacterium]|nr:mitochondrial fission ELM1 family protein [Hyphomonadaceae bacterium]
MARLVATAGLDALAAVAGRSGWIISDGRAGNDVQSRGVFDALGLDYVVKPVTPHGIWKVLAPWGPVDPAERFGTSASPFRTPWPEFAVAIGRTTIPYVRKLKAFAGLSTYTIILLDPKVSATAADLFWVPEHDRRRGPNVITTLTAPHGFTARRIAELRTVMPPAIAALPRPRFAVALGGPNGDYRYTPGTVAHLASALQSLAALGAGLMITPSRRTPPPVAAFVKDATEGLARLWWDGEGDNPYPSFLAHADAFIAPADSVNMTGEPCATGKPIYVFKPEGGSRKFARFHDALHRHGATRPLPARFERLETWDYPPITSAEAIATEIAGRWLKRRQMLGAPAQGGSASRG